MALLAPLAGSVTSRALGAASSIVPGISWISEPRASLDGGMNTQQGGLKFARAPCCSSTCASLRAA
eukprot:6848061-Alexandrium_andersonii.AAC.1